MTYIWAENESLASVTGSANVKCLTANFYPLVKLPEIPSTLPLANACHCAPPVNSFVQTPCPHILPHKDQLHFDSLIMPSFFFFFQVVTFLIFPIYLRFIVCTVLTVGLTDLSFLVNDSSITQERMHKIVKRDENSVMHM